MSNRTINACIDAWLAREDEAMNLNRMISVLLRPDRRREYPLVTMMLQDRLQKCRTEQDQILLEMKLRWEMTDKKST